MRAYLEDVREGPSNKNHLIFEQGEILSGASESKNEDQAELGS